MPIQAVIFDLDGVIVSTDEGHYQAWKKMADEEGIYFDAVINKRLKGVSRMGSLEIILEKASKQYSQAEKLSLANRKNDYYREYIQNLTSQDILPGVLEFIKALKARAIKVAIGSSSKNTPIILEKIGLSDLFDAIADGNEISKSKPDPEVYQLAAKKLGIPAEYCLVVEDAEAGIEAALAAGMKVLGVGDACTSMKATFRSKNLQTVNLQMIIGDSSKG